MSYTSLYTVVFRFPLTWLEGPNWNYGKQPQTIIAPPPDFVVAIVYSGKTVLKLLKSCYFADDAP